MVSVGNLRRGIDDVKYEVHKTMKDRFYRYVICVVVSTIQNTFIRLSS